jgi:disulfide bond formation protein DsbB
MFEIFPVLDVVKRVLTGSGECAKIDWTFLGVSMPGWVLIWALALGIAGLIINWPRRSSGAWPAA